MRSNRKNADSFALMAESNNQLVLEVVCRNREISRAELARKTKLQPTTISNIVTRLMEEGYLADFESESDNGNGKNVVGRPARLLRLNDKAKLAMAIDLEPDRLRLALVNVNFDILAYSEYGMNRFARSDQILMQIISAAKSLLSANESWSPKIVAAGVSLPGQIDIKRGISCGSTNMPNWKNVAIVKRLKDAIGLPVRIERSNHLAALAEKWRRPITRDRNVLCVVLRTGVGLALLLKGSLYHGASHLDGELGHTCVEPSGKLCECGKTGCLETMISTDAICQQGVEMINSGKGRKLLGAVDGNVKNITPEIIYELAATDPGCEQIVRNIARHLAFAISNIAQILNPNEVVICGSIDMAEDIIVQEFESVFDESLLAKTRSDLTVLVSPYKDRASLFGAAALIFDELFHSPLLGFSEKSMSATK